MVKIMDRWMDGCLVVSSHADSSFEIFVFEMAVAAQIEWRSMRDVYNIQRRFMPPC